jgi:uncharacterized iron-regulated membrane protein
LTWDVGCLLPLACSGHVLLDLPIFFGPVFLLTAWILWMSRREKRRRRTPPAQRPESARAG